MARDGFWRLFILTGNIGFYLLYRERAGGARQGRGPRGRAPREG